MPPWVLSMVLSLFHSPTAPQPHSPTAPPQPHSPTTAGAPQVHTQAHNPTHSPTTAPPQPHPPPAAPPTAPQPHSPTAHNPTATAPQPTAAQCQHKSTAAQPHNPTHSPTHSHTHSPTHRQPHSPTAPQPHNPTAPQSPIKQAPESSGSAKPRASLNPGPLAPEARIMPPDRTASASAERIFWQASLRPVSRSYGPSASPGITKSNLRWTFTFGGTRLYKCSQPRCTSSGHFKCCQSPSAFSKQCSISAKRLQNLSF